MEAADPPIRSTIVPSGSPGLRLRTGEVTSRTGATTPLAVSCWGVKPTVTFEAASCWLREATPSANGTGTVWLPNTIPLPVMVKTVSPARPPTTSREDFRATVPPGASDTSAADITSPSVSGPTTSPLKSEDEWATTPASDSSADASDRPAKTLVPCCRRPPCASPVTLRSALVALA